MFCYTNFRVADFAVDHISIVCATLILRWDGGATALVKCHVMWHLLAARGYDYHLERGPKGWRVVRVVPTWLS